jgi:peptidoglycan/LPS O-acetylase OafA/YrhL
MTNYRREIDGLRALALLPVIFFHAGFGLFSGGFVGVDVFFVISGYLITSILLAEREAGAFSLIDFYERRARRILPALFCVMAASLPLAWFWLLPDDMTDFSRALSPFPSSHPTSCFGARAAISTQAPS